MSKTKLALKFPSPVSVARDILWRGTCVGSRLDSHEWTEGDVVLLPDWSRTVSKRTECRAAART